MAIVDGGNRREFNTGAVRDIADGKGRCDLLPIKEVACLIESNVLLMISKFMECGDTVLLNKAIRLFCTENHVDVYTAILEVSKHFEEGCNKYGERNWEKGIPLHCYIDSAIRHYLKFSRGDTDERHDRAFVWNILCATWTLNHKTDCIDIDFLGGKDNEAEM